MEWLYPRIRLRELPAMIRIAVLGALLAGIYGAIHDQISYTISEEYFTKLKFHQFSYADFGWHPRLFAAEVGFLASWWVGLIAAWLLARAGLSELPTGRRVRCTAVAFAMVGLFSLVGSAATALYATVATLSDGYGGWESYRQALGLQDLRGFVIVAHLHNGSYAGALLGFIAAATLVHWQWRAVKKQAQEAAHNSIDLRRC